MKGGGEGPEGDLFIHSADSHSLTLLSQIFCRGSQETDEQTHIDSQITPSLFLLLFSPIGAVGLQESPELDPA